MEPLTARAYAKVNLALEVLGRRPDGYHEVRTVLQSISLQDELTFRPAPSLTLRCGVPELETPDNLVLRAARLLQEDAGVREGAAIELRKGIPVAAGLGGGSADAAAALLALDRLWGLSLPQGRLMALAAELGADVPFCLLGGTALAWGRGAEVMPLRALPETWLVLLCPRVSLPRKTATVYAALDARAFSVGQAVEALAGAIQRGEPLPEACMVNSFEKAAHQAFPGLAGHRDALREAGPTGCTSRGRDPRCTPWCRNGRRALAWRSVCRRRGWTPAWCIPSSPSRAGPAPIDTGAAANRTGSLEPGRL
jgi:4-diphosphocytidyl-2-C-methyl-D-erythritol kinase